MHILDLIIYFVILILLWKFLGIISGRQFTEEMGGAMVGIPIMIIYTTFYIGFFACADYNWIDIFRSFNYSEWFKL